SELKAGAHSYNWNARNIASGVYFYRLQSGSFTQVKKMMLLK
ncbi:MAG: T9SS type A sorting domain-containing protein, partial [Chlorobiales bacterium]|nr:T9SS type A sorting domain-containing protein [Chlorobiales bacterium]